MLPCVLWAQNQEAWRWVASLTSSLSFIIPSFFSICLLFLFKSLLSLLSFCQMDRCSRCPTRSSCHIAWCLLWHLKTPSFFTTHSRHCHLVTCPISTTTPWVTSAGKTQACFNTSFYSDQQTTFNEVFYVMLLNVFYFFSNVVIMLSKNIVNWH